MTCSAADEDNGGTHLDSVQTSNDTLQLNSLRNYDMDDEEDTVEQSDVEGIESQSTSSPVTATNGSQLHEDLDSLLNLQVFTHNLGRHRTSSQWLQPLAFALCGAQAGCPCCIHLFRKGSSRNEHILFCPTITRADDVQLLLLSQHNALDSVCSFPDGASCDISTQPPLPLPLAASTHHDQLVDIEDRSVICPSSNYSTQLTLPLPLPASPHQLESVTIQECSLMPDVSKGVLDGNLIIFMYQSAFAHAAMGIPDVVESPPPPLLLSDEYVKVSVQGRLPL